MLDYWDIVANYLSNRAFMRHFNQAAKVPFLFDASSGQFISYDDAESLSYKVRSRLGGAMYWEITADYDASLLDLLSRELLSGKR